MPSHIPVSAKIRLGYNDSDKMDLIAKAVQKAGTSWLTVHARTKVQGYRPPAYWEKIAPFTTLGIPVIANGEIWHADHATDCMTKAQTPHLMLGRGAVTHPDLIATLTNKNNTLSWQALLPYQLMFLADNTDNEKGLIGRYKQWLGMLTRGYDEAVDVWDVVKRQKGRDEIIKILQQTF